MERAARNMVTPGLAQGYIAVDDINYVNAGQQIIDELLWDQAGHGSAKYKLFGDG